MLLALLLALALPLAAAAQGTAEPGRRMALVVGNGAYDSLPGLPNAVGDARALAEQLRALDFDVVLLTDIDLASFDVALDGFATRAAGAGGEAGAEAVLFYFSGHAVQMAGANWLAPREAALHDPGSIAAQMIRLDAVIARIAAPGRQTIVLLDACRNDPRPAALRETLPEGLAPLQSGLQSGLQGGPETGRDLFVAFATQPGNTASDGPPGGHSQFTEALLDHLPLTGQPIAEMMIGVRNQVSARTLGRQVPWDQSSLTAPFFFAPLVLGEADYDLLAGMGPAQREWTLAIWRSQGARIDMEDVTRRMAALEGPGDIGQGTEAETGRDPDTGPSDAGPSEIELAAAETTEETPAPEARTIAPLPAPTASLAPLPPRVAAIEVNPETPAETPAEPTTETTAAPPAQAAPETPAETAAPVIPPDVIPEAIPEAAAPVAQDNPDPGNAGRAERQAACRALAHRDRVDLQALSDTAEAAIIACRAALAAGPDHPETMALLARALAAAGRNAEAYPLYARAAQAGNPLGTLGLGYMYHQGHGVTRNDQEAVRWFRVAAEAGDILGMYNLGVMYAGGHGVTRDDREAVRWFRAAAEAGNDAGMYNLGVMYSGGLGVAQDHREAARWFRAAAEAGNSAGMSGLGVMYSGGHGVTRDDREAARWYRAAAEAGDSLGMYNLGSAYAGGHGVPLDPVRAAELFLASARGGDTSFRELAPRHRRETIREVQRLLAAAGHYRGALDGVWGPASTAALDAYAAQR